MSNIPTQVQYWIDQLEIDQAEHIKDDYKKQIQELISHCQRTLTNYVLNSKFRNR
jgi:hypothetical protein